MKLFFTVFSAVLAAAVVIITGLWGKSRLDGWEQAKALCYAQMNTELSAMKTRTQSDQAEMDSMARTAMDSTDVARIAAHASRSLDAVAESRSHLKEIERALTIILENKPFNLPLTGQERNDLESAKKDIATDEDSDMQQRISANKKVIDEAEQKAKRSLDNLRNTAVTRQDFSVPQGQYYFVVPAGTKFEGAEIEGTNAIVTYNGVRLLVPLTLLEFPNKF